MPTPTTVTTSPREQAEQAYFREVYGRPLHRATKRTELDSKGRGYIGWTLFVREVPEERARVFYITAPHPYLEGRVMVVTGSHHIANTAEVYFQRLIQRMRREIQFQRQCRRDVQHPLLAGRYLDRQRRLNNVDIEDHKKPPKKDLSRWCSIEVECIVPDDVRQKLYRELNGDIDFRRHLTWKSDSSISPDEDEEQGVEFVLCAPLSKFNGFVDKLCKTLHDWEVYVNDSCGLHVHLDQRQNTPDDVETKVYPNLAKAQPLLQRLVKKERITSTYCYESPMQWDSRSRYRAINARAYEQHGTLEVRLHHGTLNPTRIKSWVSLLWAVADKGVKEETSVATALRALELEADCVTELLRDAEPTPLTWPAPVLRPSQPALMSQAAILEQRAAYEEYMQMTRRAVTPRSESVSGGNAEGTGQVVRSDVPAPSPVAATVRPRPYFRDVPTGSAGSVPTTDPSSAPDVSGTTRTTPYPIGWRVAVDPASVIQVSADFAVITIPDMTRNLWKLHSTAHPYIYVMEAAGTQADYDRYVHPVYVSLDTALSLRGQRFPQFRADSGLLMQALGTFTLARSRQYYSVLAARVG